MMIGSQMYTVLHMHVMRPAGGSIAETFLSSGTGLVKVLRFRGTSKLKLILTNGICTPENVMFSERFSHLKIESAQWRQRPKQHPI